MKIKVSNTPKAKEFAKKLRKQMTLEELRLWGVLRRKGFGIRFNRQEPIGKYIVDFISHNVKLIIEIDGEQHSLSLTDKERDAYLTSLGYYVLRIPNKDIRYNFDDVRERISRLITDLIDNLPPSVSFHSTASPNGEADETAN